MLKARPDAVPNLRQYLNQLSGVAMLRDRLRQHRNEGKQLRRLLKLATESEAEKQDTGGE